ncbi:MAG: nuclear receptor-binding factor 2 [Bacteroidaceae bacterium]|nr:nuclear receptor-binding factor 2 [Bacteroidaceae bacterium]
MEKCPPSYYFKLFAVCLGICLIACRPSHPESFAWDGGIVKLNRIHDSLSIISYERDGEELSSWKLPYPVYRFDWGDVNADGLPEIAVGVIKSTRFFSQPAKRLFLFKLYKGKMIRPLWLGSHVANELIDFRIERDSLPALIHTVERLDNDSIVHVEYQQQGFGIKYLKTLP